MQLDVRLYAGLQCNNQKLPCFGEKEFLLTVPEEITVEDLFEMLQVDLQYPLVVLVNGRSRPKDWVLSENDRVALFPPVGGG